MKFSIGLVFYSGKEDLETCISSLLAQEIDTKEFEILLRDHSEKKDAITYIEKKFTQEVLNKKIVLFSGENLFHSGGHNFLMSEMQAENYICASIDMKYDAEMLQNFKTSLLKKQEYSCFGGKLVSKDEVIDSTGIEKTWYFQFYDRGQGENKNNFAESEQVFGITGALFCIRNKLIEKLSLGLYQNGRVQVFNEKLHYKNDVDLMCRIHLLHEKCWYDSSVYAIHNRGIGKDSMKSAFAKESSLKGQKYLVTNYASFSSSFIPWWQKGIAWAGITVKKALAK